MAESKKTATSGGSKKKDTVTRPQAKESVTVQSAVEENSLEDIEVAMRDNPGLRGPENVRRHLPPEEYPSGHQVRKDEEKAKKAVEKAIDSLEKTVDEVGTADVVLSGKVREALRVLKR